MTAGHKIDDANLRRTPRGYEYRHVERFTATVFVEYWLPVGIVDPFALNTREIGGPRPVVTQTKLRYHVGRAIYEVPARYAIDGKSWPWWLRWVPGVKPLDKDIWWTALHDRACEFPDEIPRWIGDALFGFGLQLTRHRDEQDRLRGQDTTWWGSLERALTLRHVRAIGKNVLQYLGVRLYTTLYAQQMGVQKVERESKQLPADGEQRQKDG